MRGMFDGIKNIGGLMDLMKNARQLQDRMKTMQDELAKKTVIADAGAGAVTATVNGRLELIKIAIDKSRVDPTDTEMLEDLIVSAVQLAQEKAAAMTREELARAASEMGLPPGMLP
jgi:DNA-binding YbaB/EbfC family protein